MRDTCILRGHQDTCGIHAGYMRDTCVSQMHPERDVSDTKATCGIHAGYIRDTCGIHVSSVAIQIHSGSMQDTCGIHAGYVSRGLGECFDAIIVCSTPMYPDVSNMYRECILCAMYLRLKIHCILNVSSMYLKCILISLGKIHFL
jgi:hypothetical protein